MDQPLLSNQESTKNKKSYFKHAIVGLVAVIAVCCCCNGTKNEILPQNVIQNAEKTELGALEPIELNAMKTMDSINKYYKYTHKFIAVA
jgi:hypothetical protein